MAALTSPPHSLSYTRSVCLLPRSFVPRTNRFFGPLKLKPKADAELPKPDSPDPARGIPMSSEYVDHTIPGSGKKKLSLPKGAKYKPKFKHLKQWWESISDSAIGKVEPGDNCLAKWFLEISLGVFRFGTVLLLAAGTRFGHQFIDKRFNATLKKSDECMVTEEKEETESESAVEIFRLERKLDETGKFSWVLTDLRRRKKKID